MKAPPPWLFQRLGANDDKLPLRQMVANFQSKAGIPSDGVIGLQTLVMLSRAAANTPRLEPQ